jgi:hypothetical protein
MAIGKKAKAAEVRRFKAGKPVKASVARRAAREAQAAADYQSARAQARARNRRRMS